MADITAAIGKMNDVEIDTDAAVTEALMIKIGANINALIESYFPVGTIVESMLTEAQFQAEKETTTWVLADGRNVAASAYESLTGNSNVPDLRGVFRRGKNNGRSDGYQNPDGDLSLGAIQANQNQSHGHSPLAITTLVYGPYGGGFKFKTDAAGVDINTTIPGGAVGTSGGNESRPTTVTVNVFIRIN